MTILFYFSLIICYLILYYFCVIYSFPSSFIFNTVLISFSSKKKGKIEIILPENVTPGAVVLVLSYLYGYHPQFDSENALGILGLYLNYIIFEIYFDFLFLSFLFRNPTTSYFSPLTLPTTTTTSTCHFF